LGLGVELERFGYPDRTDAIAGIAQAEGLAEVGEAGVVFAEDGLVVEVFGVASGLPGLELLVELA
jgi:hypothetical protein